MSTELHLEDVDATLFYNEGPGVPDAVRLGSGELFIFVQREMPKVGGNKAALYKRAKVAEYPLLFLSSSDPSERVVAQRSIATRKGK